MWHKTKPLTAISNVWKPSRELIGSKCVIMHNHYRLLAFLILILAGFNLSAREKQVPRIVNFINFVRDFDPRETYKTPQALFETTKSEADIIHKHGFKGTWLLQYDALIDSRYHDFMREEMAHGCEVGGWWEITQPHVEAAGYKWRGRFPWDWHADVGFAVGYTQKERERLVDVYMEKFREIFGELPHSVGSWFIDAHTLAYMREKYGIEASCNCRDQVGTDGYTLHGGYWHGAYYPSRLNAYMPAQTKEGQIDLPVFRMLGSDPLYQIDRSIGGREEGIVTMEPCWPSGKKPEWIRWYLHCQTEDPALGYTYFQAGQENAFVWSRTQKGFEAQLPLIAQFHKEGKLRVETLIETARNFRKQNPVTPPNACTALTDYNDQGGRTIWFNCRNYRANVLWTGDRMGIRDIHLFNEHVESPYYNHVCTSNKCVYMTLPIVDGCLWSTKSDRAFLRFYAIEGGRITELHGGEPVITEMKRGMKAEWPLKEHNASIVIQFNEKGLKATCTDKKLSWCMQLNVQPSAELPFLTIGGKNITASQNGFSYGLSLKKGTFEDLRQLQGMAYRIIPEGGAVEMKMN